MPQHIVTIITELLIYLEAKSLSSEVATLVVDQTKLQLQGTVLISRHLQECKQEGEQGMRQNNGGKRYGINRPNMGCRSWG